MVELASTVRTAEFWISLLEGEHAELAVEVKKQKQRLQDSRGVAEAKSSALREAEGEKRRLEAELKWLRESRDKAICERSIAKDSNQRIEKNSKLDMDALAAKADSLEDILAQEKRDKQRLEQAYVRTKVQYADVLQQKDSMECLIAYYEDQLKVLNPSFEKVDLNTASAWLRPMRSPDGRDSELHSEPSSTDLDIARAADPAPSEPHQGKSRGLMNLTKIRSIFKKSPVDKEEKEVEKSREPPKRSARTGKMAAATDQPPVAGAGKQASESAGPTPRSSRGDPNTPCVSARTKDEEGPVESPVAMVTSRESSSAPSDAPRKPKLKRSQLAIAKAMGDEAGVGLP